MHFSLSTLLVPLILVANVLGQAIVITNPPAGATIQSGSSFTAQITRPMGMQGSIEVGFAIGLLPCGTAPCPPASERVGRLLYNGPYRPQRHEVTSQPYQNFTLAIPPADEFPTGVAQLSTIRLHLIGAGPYPIFEVQSTTINVV